MTDVIELRGLRALGYIGALAEEQQRRQPFEVDLDVEVDLSQSGHSDDLDDTVDYGALCATVEGIIESAWNWHRRHPKGYDDRGV